MNHLLSPSARRLLALAILLMLVAGVLLLRASSSTSATLIPSFSGSQDADGAVGDVNLTIDDTQHPAISGLDPDLRVAVEAASRSANRDGVALQITSGWRSVGYQQRLLERAIENYGSESEARRWVATPMKSAHVRGEAVDIGPTDAAYWMAQHGPQFGLCQVYANEVWHYELLTSPGGVCPEMKTDGAS